MANKHSRQRRQEKPLRRLAAFCRRDITRVCEEFSETLSPETERHLVTQLVVLSDPWTFPVIDAAVPAHRWDLRLDFIRSVVSGDLDPFDAGAVEIYARRVAPTPDERARAGVRPLGLVTYNQALQAHKARRKRKGLPMT